MEILVNPQSMDPMRSVSRGQKDPVYILGIRKMRQKEMGRDSCTCKHDLG